MCNFVKSNGAQCGLAKNKAHCHIATHREAVLAAVAVETVVEPVIEPVIEPVVIDTIVIEPVIEPVVINENSDLLIKSADISNSSYIDTPDFKKMSPNAAIIEQPNDTNGSPIFKEAKIDVKDLNSSEVESYTEDEEEDEFFFENYTEVNTAVQYDINEDTSEFIFGIDHTIAAFNDYLIEHNIEVGTAEKTNHLAYYDGFKFCFYIQHGNKTLMHYYCKTPVMLDNIPIMLSELDLTKYCLSNELYDRRLYQICCLLKKSWFSDNSNTWNLAGMLYKRQHVDLMLMRRTYMCILHTMTDRFDQAAAVKVFNDWGASKYHPKLTEAQLKSIAGGCNPIAYNEWKDEYEPKEIEETKPKKTKKKKGDADEEDTQPKYPKFDIVYEKGELPALFDCKKSETYLDVLKLKSSVITMERAYHFIKDNIAYILQGGNGYYLTKNKDAFGDIDYTIVKNLYQFDMILQIDNDIELDDNGAIEVNRTQVEEEDIRYIHLSSIIEHYRDDITFGKVDFVPYNAKTGVSDTKLNTFDWNSNEVFNKFNGFVHAYDPEFTIDTSKFELFQNHIKNVWCSGEDAMLIHMMKLFAWYVQKPYQKSGAIIVLEGEEGCGKNIAFEILKNYVIGTRYSVETAEMKKITGRFNAARENKIIGLLNEAASVNKNSHGDQEVLKDIATEPSFLIEPKGVDPYRVKDSINMFIASNNSYSVKASKQMRRFIYLLCSSDRIGDKAYFEAMLAEFENTDSGIHLYHYLMSIDLDGFHPQNDAPMTKTKSDLQKSAIEKPVQWLIECIENGTSNTIFPSYKEDKTHSIAEFVSIDDMQSKFTTWLIEECRDTTSYSRDRFSKTLTKVLGPSERKSISGIRKRAYSLSVNGLKDSIIKYTRRSDLFE